jgi:hypothetical protein
MTLNRRSRTVCDRHPESLPDLSECGESRGGPLISILLFVTNESIVIGDARDACVNIAMLPLNAVRSLMETIT